MGAASFAAGLLKLLCSADQWKDDDGKFRGKKSQTFSLTSKTIL
ncbi:hypothetical protein AT236_01650 [Lactobacillus delbrueckii subsp. bulgaricus]|nr:hypothetical protein AT236_01650 [Lactobacillus delbrueckii subsp. bulgaricus]